MRSKTKKHTSYKSRKTKKIPLAGQAIAAGGFGCVFRPAIKCDTQADRVKQEQHNYISKIMKNRYADDEMEEVNRFLPVIKTIPNNKNYFLLDGIFKCRPANLTSSDKKNLNVKCGNLTREGIRENNINNNLSRIQALNIPDGGVSVRKTMEDLATKLVRKDKEQERRFGHLNNSLIRTLKNAIVPMNKRGIIHCDIKGDNMLVKQENLGSGEPYVKIIDWGLGGKFNPSDRTVIPDAVKNRPIQFNVPFGVILFDDDVIRAAANSMSLTFAGDSIYKIFAYKILEKTNLYGPGHTAYLTKHLFPDLTNPFIRLDSVDKPEGFAGEKSSDVKKTLFANGIIVTHIQKVLEKYYNPSTRSFNKKAYFHDVYRWNVDIWGFLMNYIELLTKAASNSYSRYRENYPLQILANILYKYCFSGNYAAEKIPEKELEKELQAVSKAIPGFKSKGIIKDKPEKHKKKAATKKKKMKIKLRAKTPSPQQGSIVSIPAGKKRCPKGYVKDIPTGKCRKKGTKKAKAARKVAKKPKSKTNSPKMVIIRQAGVTYAHLPQGKKRCPKGFKRVLGGEANAPHVRILCERVAKKSKPVAKKAKATRKVAKHGMNSQDFDKFRRLKEGTADQYETLFRARDKTRKRCPKGYKKVVDRTGSLVCKKK